MNHLPASTRITILRLLTEGGSLRSISRVTGTSINTMSKLLVEAGRACAHYQHDMMRNLKCDRLQLNVIWGFVYAKD